MREEIRLKGEKMTRYIDVDEIFYDQLLNTGRKDHPLEYAVSKRRIDDMPSADVVEVVRCKDCMFYDSDEPWCTRLGLYGAFHDDDFCSHGEREVEDVENR